MVGEDRTHARLLRHQLLRPAVEGRQNPFELAEAKFGRGFCEALRIRKVDKKKVRLLAAI